MPTRHPRIPVTKDPALARALDDVSALFPRKPPATIVHDLAVKGAAALLAEHRLRDQALERLVTVSTRRCDALDWSVLERVDELAWGD